MTSASPRAVEPLQLEEILDLERTDRWHFRGVTPPTHLIRVFGGQVSAQALVAAGRTVDVERSVHSLHAYFLRPGDPTMPIDYEVEPIRDGRSFTTRRVVATQRREAIFTMSASFQRHEDGPAHQIAVLDAPHPDDVPDVTTQIDGYPDAVRARYEQVGASFPVDIRFVDGLPSVEARGLNPSPRQRIWIRSPPQRTDDALMHVCSLAYASDLFLLGSTLAPHQLDVRDVDARSLDHAMWFHAPFRVDEWLLHDQEGSWAGTGRGLARAQIFNVTGTLVATVMQEGLLRRRTA